MAKEELRGLEERQELQVKRDNVLDRIDAEPLAGQLEADGGAAPGSGLNGTSAWGAREPDIACRP